ncbi:MAG: T9SS type A sorting domain-containing protein [Flavobacteriales bacterium]|nr:T9SS type A sorting domain-containing protein [Flavobacteriales bacterium]
MKPVLLLLLCIGLSQGICAQELEHATQSSLSSQYSAVALGTNGNWFLAGNHQQVTSFLPSIIREMDSAGQIVGEWSYSIPGNDVTEVNDLMARADGSMILSGYAKPSCDVGIEVGFVSSFFQGTLQWQQFYSAPVRHIAQNDSLMALATSDRLLFTDLFGDSLYSTLFPLWDFPRRVCATDQGFVAMGNFGARGVLPDGTPSDSLLDAQVSDMIQMPGGSLLAVTVDSLIELAPDLQRTGNGVRVVGYEPRRVAYSGGFVRVHTLDTLFTFTSNLAEISAIPTDNPWDWTLFILNGVGYLPKAAEFGNSIVMTAGASQSGAYCAACRSLPLDSSPTQLESNAELRNLTVDTLSYTIESWWVSGTASARVWLHNLGDTPLTSVTLNILTQSFCGLEGHSQSYDTLALAPGDSIHLDFGPFSYHEFIEPMDSLVLCVWAARPNYRIDREPLGNKVCTSIALDPATGSLDPTRSEFPILFPNPAIGQIVLRPNLPQHGSFDVTFLDLQGRAVLKRSMNYTGTPLRIDIAGLTAGVYIVEIAQAGHRSSHRLIVE